MMKRKVLAWITNLIINKHSKVKEEISTFQLVLAREGRQSKPCQIGLVFLAEMVTNWQTKRMCDRRQLDLIRMTRLLLTSLRARWSYVG